MEKLKEFFLKNYKLWLFIIIVIAVILFFRSSNIEQQKQIEILSKKSNEEIIIQSIKTKKEFIINITNEIKAKELLLELNKKQELCFKQQLNRLIEWLEYQIDYCNDKNNLDKFQGLD